MHAVKVKKQANVRNNVRLKGKKKATKTATTVKTNNKINISYLDILLKYVMIVIVDLIKATLILKIPPR